MACLFGLLLLHFENQFASAQIRYPVTQYRSYGSMPQSSDSFAISSPLQTDSVRSAEVNDFRSMSPDSWETPQSGFNPADNPFQTSPNGQGSSRSSFPENLQLNNQRQLQTPNDDRYFKPTLNQSLHQNKFRPTSHPLSKQSDRNLPSNATRGTENPLEPTPSMPDDIRIPDLQTPTQQNEIGSLLEPDPTQPTTSSTPFPPQVQNGPDQSHLPAAVPGQLQSSIPSAPDALGSYPLTPQGSQSNTEVPGVPVRDRRPLWQRRPVLTPSAAPPLATAPPAFSPNRVALDNFYQPQSQFFPFNAESLGANPLPAPNYRPDLGHRDPNVVTRDGATNDYGQTFDFEKKHIEYPKLGEILKTGRYFGSATALYLRPAFQANTSLFLNQSGVTETFDFAYKLSPKIQLGFESKFGPGIELEYWGYSDFSRVSSFTSNGIETATTSAWMRGANQWSRLSAVNAGETLTARHRMELDVVGASFFKEVKLPIARINGKFGFQTAHIIHELTAQVNDGAGTQIGSLRSRSDVRGFGPQFELEYFRPIGHTKMEFLTTASGSVLFGKQSQVIENSTLGNQSRMKADEFVLTFDFFSGAQYRLMWGENRYWFARTGMLYQAWLHGGTAVLPQDDFGLRGFAVTAGLNR